MTSFKGGLARVFAFVAWPTKSKFWPSMEKSLGTPILKCAVHHVVGVKWVSRCVQLSFVLPTRAQRESFSWALQFSGDDDKVTTHLLVSGSMC